MNIPFHCTKTLIVTLVVFVCSACGPNIDALSLKNEAGDIQAVIEIPAGTNLKIEYDKQASRFKPDQIDGKDRVIDFLGYPANYGFLPGTYHDPKDGGDGDPLDILVLSSSVESGSIVPIKVIGVLKTRDDKGMDEKIIAIPVDPQSQTVRATNFVDFMINYSGAQNIIETFFLNYKGMNTVQLLGWGDEQEALQIIESVRVN